MGFFRPFGLEQYFAAHEFSASHLLCTSDCESMSIADLCAMEPESDTALRSLRLGYTESRGSPSLRANIAALYGTVGPDDVIVHAGAEEAILNLCLAILEKGDRVVVNMPCYQSLAEIPRALGAEVLPWNFRIESDRWFLDPEDLARFLDPVSGGKPVKLVVLNTPHNPTGALMRRDEFDRVIELCRRSGSILLCDEVYRMLEQDPGKRLPAACDAYENGISLSVLSKSWGLAGLRIGWLASHRRDIIDAVATIKDYNSICASGPSEVLAGIALRNADLITGRNRALCTANITLLDRFFSSHETMFDWIPPEAGSIAFPRLEPKGGRFGSDAAAFAKALLHATGVLLLPGSLYGEYPAHFRIGFGRASMPMALERLEEWLDGADRGDRTDGADKKDKTDKTDREDKTDRA